MVLSNIEKYRNRIQQKTLLNLKEKDAIRKWSGLSKAKEQHLENVLRRRGATKTKNKPVIVIPDKPRQRLKKKIKPQRMRQIVNKRKGLRGIEFV